MKEKLIERYLSELKLLTVKKDFNPKEIMKPNERCWCGSNKKWKKCHKNRHLEPSNMNHSIPEMNEIKKQGFCLHPLSSSSSCNGGIIDAHTVQKKGGGLISISEKKQSEVSTFNPFNNKFGKNPTNIFNPRIASASTIRAFCKKHDCEIFSPIENDNLTLSKENAFLFSFRALSYEYFAKKKILETSSIMRDYIDRGMQFEDQRKTQEFINYNLNMHNYEFRVMELKKNLYDKIFIEKKFDLVRYYAIWFDGTLPITSCGIFSPEYDFSGKKINNFNRESISLNIISFQGKSIALFGWLDNIGNASQRYIDSLKLMNDKANAVIYAAFKEIENVYFKPSFFENLSISEQQEIRSVAYTGTPFMKDENSFLKLSKSYSQLKVVNVIDGY